MNYNVTILIVLILAAIPASADADIVRELRSLNLYDLKYEGVRHPWVVVLPESLSADNSEEITRLSYSGLDEWKRIVRRSPEYYHVDTLRYSYRNATLGVPYYRYEVDEHQMKKYMDSGKSDPRLFASRYQIYCPILVDDRCLGAVTISPNVKVNGRKSFEDEGDFTQSGYVISGPNFQKMYRKMCKVRKYTGLTEEAISLVYFGVPNLGNWYMQREHSGQWFVLEDSERGLWRRRPRIGNEKYFLQ